MKIEDFIKYRNLTFVKDCLKKAGPPVFNDIFSLTQQMHNHRTRGAYKNFVNIQQVQTSFYGINSIKHRSSSLWNSFQNKIDTTLLETSYSVCKKVIFNHYLTSYLNN